MRLCSILLCVLALAAVTHAAGRINPKPSKADVEQEAMDKVYVDWWRALEAGDLKIARQHVASIPGFAEDVNAILKDAIDSIKAKKLKLPMPFSSKTLNHCGYTTFIDNRNEKPLYLIKQEGVWKVLPAFHTYNVSEQKLTEEQMEAFAFLNAWFKYQKSLTGKN